MAIIVEVQNYGHPGSHPPAIITQDSDNRFVTDVQIASWDSAAGADGAAAAALASEQAAAASELAAGNSETAALQAQTDAETAETNAQTHETTALGAAQAASLSATEASYAEEWANTNEDVLISIDAGGDQVDDYSAKHWAAKAAKPTAVYTDAHNIFTKGYAITPAAVASAASIQLDLTDRNVFNITADQSITFANPASIPGAGTWYIYLTNDATGGYTHGLDTNFNQNEGVFDGSANAVNIIRIVSDGVELDTSIVQRV